MLVAEVLDKIAHIKDPKLNDRLSNPQGNRRGFATVSLVASNPNLSLKTLEYMADSDNCYLLGDIAGNRRLRVEYLRKLFAKVQDNQEGYMKNGGLLIILILQLIS